MGAQAEDNKGDQMGLREALIAAFQEECLFKGLVIHLPFLSCTFVFQGEVLWDFGCRRKESKLSEPTVAAQLDNKILTLLQSRQLRKPFQILTTSRVQIKAGSKMFLKLSVME